MINNKNISSFLTKLFVFLGLLVITISCSKKPPVKKEISIEELLGEELIEEVVIEEKVEVPALDGTFISEINQKLYESYSSLPHNETTLIDRFSYSKVEKASFKSLTDSLAIANFFKYDFADTTATNNAFNNWLACFGNNCDEITLKESFDKVDETPLWCGVFENSIIILKFSDSALSNKNELKQTIFQAVGLPLKHTLNVTADNMLRWD